MTNGDKNYFLSFVNNNSNCYSYAASIGGSIIEDEQIFKNELVKFTNISVREYSLQHKLQQLLNRKIEKVLDPVFLLEKKDWLKLVKDKNIKTDYIFVYVLHEKNVYKIAERISNLTGLSVICLQNKLKAPIKAKNVGASGIEDFLYYIANAKYVVTDSFHGTAFSIIFKKNFKIVMKKELKDLNERVISILNEFNLEDSIIDLEDSDDKLLENTIFKNSEEKIEESRESSKKYLREILGEK